VCVCVCVCVFVCLSLQCVCVCVGLQLSTSTWRAWKRITCRCLVALLRQSVFNMVDACDVANDSPLALDRVVETRSGQGSP